MRTIYGELTLDGDVTPEDWRAFFKQSHADVSQTARDAYAETRERLGAEPRRCDVIRDVFNAQTIKGGERRDDAVRAFYGSKFYDSLLAYSLPESGLLRGILDNTIRSQSWLYEPTDALVRAVHKEHGYDGLYYVVHGYGVFEQVLGMAAMNASSTFVCVEVKSSVRAFLLRMIKKYVDGARVVPVWVERDGSWTWPQADGAARRIVADGGVHALHTCEVLEHVPEPERELRSMVDMLVPGGYAMISTFFNSLGGDEPQHLEANDKYQDVDLWFSQVEACGLQPYWKDLRGVQKIWRKAT